MIDIFFLIIVSLISLVIGMVIGALTFIIRSKLSFIKTQKQISKNIGIIENNTPEDKTILEEGSNQILEGQREEIIELENNSTTNKENEDPHREDDRNTTPHNELETQK